MKLALDERIKHRLVGVMVIVSVAVIFLPAIMKKSNQRFEENINVSLKLPEKPTLPQVSIPNQRAMFKSVKVAHVEIPAMPASPVSQIAKAESLRAKPAAPVSVVAKVNLPAHSVPSVQVATAAVNDKAYFAVRLGVFSQRDNAQSLVNSLRSKGFEASFNKTTSKQGELYQVIVGQMNQRQDAINLQKKLAINTRLNGLIIKTGVS